MKTKNQMRLQSNRNLQKRDVYTYDTMDVLLANVKTN